VPVLDKRKTTALIFLALNLVSKRTNQILGYHKKTLLLEYLTFATHYNITSRKIVKTNIKSYK